MHAVSSSQDSPVILVLMKDVRAVELVCLEMMQQLSAKRLKHEPCPCRLGAAVGRSRVGF